MKKILKKIFIIIIILEIIASYLPAINYKVLADDETESDIKDIDSDNGKTEIQFGNQTIKEYFIQNCDFDEDKIITEADMLQVENVELNNLSSGEIDFTGLEYAKNLKSLKIDNPGIRIFNKKNIEIFKNLTKLEKLSLRLDYKNLEDISSILSSLTSLKVLDIWHADFSNVDFSKLNKLEELNIGNVKLNNIGQISCLKNLKILHIYNVYGLSDFENLPVDNLTSLTLAGCENIKSLDLTQNFNKLTELSLQSCKIDDLKFIEKSTNLTSLNLINDNIKDISVISNLTNLQILYLGENKIDDISSLGRLTKLVSLNLNNNYIKDISPLEQLNELKNLDITKNPIDIKSSAYIEVAEKLKNNGCYIVYDEEDDSEIVEFKDEKLKQTIIEKGYDSNKDNVITANEMKQIYYLEINDYNNPITDISALKYATNLSSLSLYLDCTDISAIGNLTKLTSLSLTNNEKCQNKINDITVLSNLTNLQTLSLYGININNIEVLKNFTKLTRLALCSSNITDISFLSNFKEMETLELRTNSIVDITPIKEFEKLKYIDLQDNKIEDISSMQEWKNVENMTYILLANNNIKDISVLQQVMERAENIKSFSLYGNCFEDISVIKELKKLDNFSCFNFGAIEYNINLGKIEKDSVQEIQLPKTMNQVEEIYNDLTWRVYIYDEYSLGEEDNVELTGNKYKIDTSYYGKQKIIINKSGSEKEYSYSPNKITSIRINICFEIEADGDKNKEITFKDENLNKVLLEKYDVDNDKKITEYDILNLTKLDASQSQIKDLTGIEQAINLRYVGLYGNQIKDISPLMSLDKIGILELSNNDITDITCLENRKFKHIYSIDFNYNYIDFSNNSENTKAYLNEWKKEIDVYGEASYYKDGKALLCDFASRQKYGNPEEKNKIVNMDNKIRQAIIEQLNADTNNDGQLTREEMYTVECYDYSNNKYKKLDLSNLGLTDLSGLEYLSNIECLDISNNQISNLEPISHLMALKELNASNNNIDNIDDLPYYKTNWSTKYNFSNNKISDISCLKNWIECDCSMSVGWGSGEAINYRTMEFDFSNNEITDITIVKDIRSLKYIDLRNNKVTDISSLKDYNFELNPELDDDELHEGLNDFDGINLKGNNIDTEQEGNKLAMDIFKNKGISLKVDGKKEQIEIVDEKTNIQISTIGEETAKVCVKEIEKESDKYKEASKKLEDYEILYSADISIVDGEYEGKIVVTIPVKEELNGKYVKVLHQRENGQTEEFIRKVKDASVSVEVTDLSPFYIAYNENKQEYKKGDINDDDKINVKDLEMLYECVSEAITLNSDELQRADVNDDGKVNVKDLNRLYEHVSEINPLDE